jgi:uncharacterized protein
MNKRRLVVYNQNRESFLGVRITPADTSLARLKGLIGRYHMRPDEGIWIVPSNGVHTIGVFLRLDLIYLDESQRVIELIEYFPRFRIAPIRIRAASVLELPQHTIYSSQTQKGDQLLVCSADQIEARLRALKEDVSSAQLSDELASLSE